MHREMLLALPGTPQAEPGALLERGLEPESFMME